MPLETVRGVEVAANIRNRCSPRRHKLEAFRGKAGAAWVPRKAAGRAAAGSMNPPQAPTRADYPWWDVRRTRPGSGYACPGVQRCLAMAG